MNWVLQVVRSLPNLLTLTSLFLGCVGVVLVLQSAQLWVIQDWVRLRVEIKPSPSDWGQMFVALHLLGICLILDYLDGWLARRLNAVSPMGGILDLVADVVAFGLLPAVILFRMLGMAYRLESEVEAPSSLWIYSGVFVYVVAVAYRLARFHTEQQETLQQWFVGLPAPAGAFGTAAFFLWMLYDPEAREAILRPQFVWGWTFLMSMWMVSRLRTISFKRLFPIRYRIWLIPGILITMGGWEILNGQWNFGGIFFLLFVSYLIGSLLMHIREEWMPKSRPS